MGVASMGQGWASAPPALQTKLYFLYHTCKFYVKIEILNMI